MGYEGCLIPDRDLNEMVNRVCDRPGPDSWVMIGPGVYAPLSDVPLFDATTGELEIDWDQVEVAK